MLVGMLVVASDEAPRIVFADMDDEVVVSSA